MGDRNEHILSKNITALFSAPGMRELILERHGKKGANNTRSNKRIEPTDGIWDKAVINVSKGGYLPFNKVL